MESAAARAYLGADVTARRAHNTCIVTCALGRVRFEVNDKGNTQHVSRFHDHRIVPTVFSPTSPSVQAHSEPRSGFPPSRCRRTSRFPALNARQSLRRAKGPARRDRRARRDYRCIARNATSADVSSEPSSRAPGRVALSSALALAASLGASGAAAPRDAAAFGGEIGLSDVSYAPSPCPPNQYLPNKKNTVCLTFTRRRDKHPATASGGGQHLRVRGGQASASAR